MSATIAPQPETLKENVTLGFENLEVKQNVKKTIYYNGPRLVVKSFSVVVVVAVVVFIVVVIVYTIVTRLRLHLFVCFQAATLKRDCVFLSMLENR